MMSTEHNFTKSSVQYKWLLSDLEKVDRSVTPWIVFMGHRPMYTSQLVKYFLTMTHFQSKIKKGGIEEVKKRQHMCDVRWAGSGRESTTRNVLGRGGGEQNKSLKNCCTLGPRG